MATSTADNPTRNYLNDPRGVKSWLFTRDHKRIGLMFLCLVTVAVSLGAVFALLIRTELTLPGPTVTDSPSLYNRFFTLHGAIMIFLFVLPAIPSSLGNFVLPLMLGAKDVAFPRLNLASLWLFAFGMAFFILTLALGGVDTGWTFYPPYSTGTPTAVTTAVVGAFILGFSSIFTGINFLVTIHTMRPPGMGWFRMPLFLWGLYGTAIIQILATPVLAITLLLLVVERTLGVGIFDAKLGGDPVLFQHFFWFYSHPAVYIMILPAMGIVSEVIAVFSRKHIFGYKFIAYSSLAIALLGFFVWGHHMFVSGQSPLVGMIFSALTFAVAIPSAIKVFNWVTTLYKGAIDLSPAMCFSLMFVFIFGVGGLTGLFLGSLATNIQVHDTSFVVAHFHYTMAGGTLTAFLAGLYYWWPKITGRMYGRRWGQIAAGLVFIGFNLTYFPQFVIGWQGMPRRYYDYELVTDIPFITGWQIISTVGGYLFVGGVVFAAVGLIRSLWTGARAPANPWGAATLEWQCSSPPPSGNFDQPPPVGDCYVFDDWEYDEEKGYVRVTKESEDVVST
ncbi:MAG: cbb3-type cytochrome c oxidase subunit I [Pirellulales bacterium]|nr:cbb3-type cytochrome c oxidase subunit I [Pirellulales bacterium]